MAEGRQIEKGNALSLSYFLLFLKSVGLACRGDFQILSSLCVSRLSVSSNLRFLEFHFELTHFECTSVLSNRKLHSVSSLPWVASSAATRAVYQWIPYWLCDAEQILHPPSFLGSSVSGGGDIRSCSGIREGDRKYACPFCVHWASTSRLLHTCWTKIVTIC